MALVPNFWTDSTIEIPRSVQDDWTEMLKTVSVHSGFYKAPNQGNPKGRSAAGDDSILIEQTKSVTNQYGWEIRRDVEDWTYEVVNGPPMAYDRTTYSRAYLPGLGRNFRKVEEEKTEYFTFSPLTDGDNLGRIRRISAYVVYTLPVDPTKAASAESQAKATDDGMQAGTVEDRIVSTGKLWSEATHDGTIIPESTAPQVTKWIDDVIEEHDIIEEMADRWVKWTIIKNALRPGDVQVKGPFDIKKTGFYYQFPYPVNPPKLDLDEISGGVRVEVDDGGAYWKTPWFRQEISIPADRYNIYRMKVSEPDRTAEDDLYNQWETPPAAEGPRSLMTNTTEEDFAGAPADPIPSPTSYTEPHSVDPPDEGTETVFSLIATVDNVNVHMRHDQGHAEYIDEDIVATAEYEYYATAIIADSESPDSNHEKITVGADGLHRMLMRSFDDGRGVDAVPPDDPNLPDTNYGEVVEFEIPVEDIADVIEDIAVRQFQTSDPDYRVSMEVLIPLLGLEYGQVVTTPVVQWDAWGNDLHLGTETIDDDWTLVEFTLKVERSKDGKWRTQRTALTLQEMTR